MSSSNRSTDIFAKQAGEATVQENKKIFKIQPHSIDRTATDPCTDWCALELGDGITAEAGKYLGKRGYVEVRFDEERQEYQYKYTLTKTECAYHAQEDSADKIIENAMPIFIPIRDANGNSGKIAILVDIQNDKPSIRLTGAYTNVLTGSSENHIANLSISFGAEAKGGYIINGEPTAFNPNTGEHLCRGSNGLFCINSSGQVFFTPNNYAESSFVLDISAIDGDGHIIEATGNGLVISVSNDEEAQNKYLQIKAQALEVTSQSHTISPHINNHGAIAPSKDFVITTPKVQGVSITLILDTSGSMTFVVENGQIRWDITREALINMLNKYERVYPKGTNFEVNIVTFSTPNLCGITATYQSLEYAKLAILDLPAPEGTTSYRDGLVAGQVLIENSIMRNPNYEQKVYFITDGEPTLPYVVPDTWKNFIHGDHARLLEISAIGVGHGATYDYAASQIKNAINARDKTDQYIPVVNEEYLASALLDTVNRVSRGFLDFYTNQPLPNALEQGFTIAKVVINNKVYEFDKTESVNITLHAGLTLQLYKDGSYYLWAEANQKNCKVTAAFEIIYNHGGHVLVSKDIIFDFHHSAPLATKVEDYWHDYYPSNAANCYDFRLGSFSAHANTGAPTDAQGADLTANLNSVLTLPNAGISLSNTSYIVIRAKTNIDKFMPYLKDGTKMTVKKLFALTGTNPNICNNAGFITLPTVRVQHSATFVVRWYWDGGSSGETEAAFWILVDSSGTMVQFEQFASGNLTINDHQLNLQIGIDAPGDYRVMLVTADGFKLGGLEASWDAYLAYGGSYVVLHDAETSNSRMSKFNNRPFGKLANNQKSYKEISSPEQISHSDLKKYYLNLLNTGNCAENEALSEKHTQHNITSITLEQKLSYESTHTDRPQNIVREVLHVDNFLDSNETVPKLDIKGVYKSIGLNPNLYAQAELITLPAFVITESSTMVVPWSWDNDTLVARASAFWVLVNAAGEAVYYDQFASGDSAPNTLTQNFNIVVDSPGEYRVVLIVHKTLRQEEQIAI